MDRISTIFNIVRILLFELRKYVQDNKGKDDM